MEGYYPIPQRLNMQEPFHFRPSTLSLIFSCGRSGHIKDLRRGIRRCFSEFYPEQVAMMLALAPVYNWIFTKDKSRRCIMLTADFQSNSDTVLIDLYARLQQRQSTIRTATAEYTVVLDGTLDHQRINALCQHYFWMSGFYETRRDTRGSRHLLN